MGAEPALRPTGFEAELEQPVQRSATDTHFVEARCNPFEVVSAWVSVIALAMCPAVVIVSSGDGRDAGEPLRPLGA